MRANYYKALAAFDNDMSCGSGEPLEFSPHLISLADVSSVTAVLLGGVAHAQQAPLQPSPIKRTPLGKVDVPGSNYEVVFSITELAAGFKSGRHSHPGVVLAYVAEGEFWYLVDGQPERVYKVGESFLLPDGAIHNEGAAGSNPVKVMAVFVVEKGKPMVQPAQ